MPADRITRLRVDYRHEKPGSFTGNILWPTKAAMRDGRFPADHPCAPGSKFYPNAGDSQLGTSDQMNAFRARGYWASCVPEGDGITMRCLGDQTPDRVVSDIREVFGWDVRALP